MELVDFVSMGSDKPDSDQCHYMPTCMQLTGEEAASDGNTTQSCSSDPQIQRRGPGPTMNGESSACSEIHSLTPGLVSLWLDQGEACSSAMGEGDSVQYGSSECELKSHEISFPHNVRFSSQIPLKICTRHGCGAPVSCVKFRNEWFTET